MRKSLMALALSFLATSAYAADNYAATQGSGKTFRCVDVGGICHPVFIPFDSAGAAFGVTGNPFYVVFPSAQSVTANAGTNLNTSALATSANQTNASAKSQIVDGSGNVIGATSNALDINIKSGNPTTIATIPATSGGLAVYFVQPAASDNHVVIKAGAGQVYKISATNNSATINYLRLYNATTGFNGCNSATNLVYQMAIPASTAGAGISDSWESGIAFATGISICVTSGYATTDTTNATASAMSVNVGYK